MTSLPSGRLLADCFVSSFCHSSWQTYRDLVFHPLLSLLHSKHFSHPHMKYNSLLAPFHDSKSPSLSYNRPTVVLATDCRSTVGDKMSANCRLTHRPTVDRLSVDPSTDGQPTVGRWVGRLSTDSRPTIDRQGAKVHMIHVAFVWRTLLNMLERDPTMLHANKLHSFHLSPRAQFYMTSWWL